MSSNINFQTGQTILSQYQTSELMRGACRSVLEEKNQALERELNDWKEKYFCLQEDFQNLLFQVKGRSLKNGA